MAYTTYIRPIVEYASPVWDPNTKRNANKIEMVQHRCVRYVTGIFDHTSSVTSLLIFQTGQPKSHLAQEFTAADSLYNSVEAMFCCALSFLLSSFKLANQNLILHKSSQLPTPCTIL